MTNRRDIIYLQERIVTAVDQLVYSRQSEWTKWGGLAIDRHNLRNLICDAVFAEIERTFPGHTEGVVKEPKP